MQGIVDQLSATHIKIKPGKILLFGLSLFLFLCCVKLCMNSYAIDSKSHQIQVQSSSIRDSWIAQHLKESEYGYQRYLEKRRALVDSKHPEKIDPWKIWQMIYFYDFFLPEFSCPHSTRRIGQMGDGGKWVCGFELFEKRNHPDEKSCIIYSFGVGEDSSFEAEVLEQTNCRIWSFDASVENMGSHVMNNSKIDKETLKSNLKFEKTFIWPSDSNGRKTLGKIMKENGHDWIDILKMDIEGQEFSVFEQILNEFPNGLPFGQLQIEIHGGTSSQDFAKVYKFWEKLEERGLRPFMNEVNPVSCVNVRELPILMEYSFINTNYNERNRLIH